MMKIFKSRRLEVENILGIEYKLQQHENKFRIFNSNNNTFSDWYCSYKSLIRDIENKIK